MHKLTWTSTSTMDFSRQKIIHSVSYSNYVKFVLFWFLFTLQTERFICISQPFKIFKLTRKQATSLLDFCKFLKIIINHFSNFRMRYYLYQTTVWCEQRHNSCANSTTQCWLLLTVPFGRWPNCSAADFLCLGSSDGLSYNIKMDWYGSSLVSS